MKTIFTLLLVGGLCCFLMASSSTYQTVIQPISNPETTWGPDTYGYIAKDSNEPGGPAFNWIDISTIGTPVSGLGDDNIVGPFNVGFPFRFYWYDVTSFYIGSNGYLRFSGGGQLSHPFTFIPNTLPPNDLICFYTADFDPSAAGTVYYWTNNVDTLIVSFDDVPAWSATGPSGSHYFQVVLSMVDTSITFNYGPQTGSFYDNAGMVGIENVAGDIGIECYNTNLVPNHYSIKFYYPQTTTYQVHDVAVTRVHNETSGGFFVETGQAFQTNATIQNTGNQHEGDFHAIAEVRVYPSGAILFSDSVFIDTLEAGQSVEVNFSEMWTMSTAGNYYVRVRTDLPGDMVAANNLKDVEMHVVSLPGELLFDDGSSEQTWSWSGGQGGMGVRYVPPTYPVKVTQIKAYLGSGILPCLLEIYDDDGPGGEPGTLLSSTTVNAPALGWYSVNLVDSGIVIYDGAVYAAWRMTGENSPGVGIDGNSIGSRQTFEYTGVWAIFRNAEVQDAMLRISVAPVAQTVFFDDFESGMTNWTGDWALTTEASHSPTHSYTDSPNSNYPNNAVLIGAMANGVDLSTFFGASLEFYTKYELETGFDYCYLEASDDGGSTWYHLKTYNGEGVVTQFTQEVVDLGGFAGKSDVRIRFRLVTDAGYQTDGMYVDDLKIIGLTVDNSPPMMVFQAPQHYEGVPDSFYFPVKITDLSGVASAQLTYWVDNALPTIYTIPPTHVSNDTFYFVIPPQEHGAMVSFYVEAVDSATPPNTAVTDTMRYISGIHLIYDDGEPEYIVELQPNEMIATKFNAPYTPISLKTLLLRIYTDISHPIDSVTVHVWADNNGMPGADLIQPFKKYPDCTLENPEAWTLVDLRSANLSPGAVFWVGYELPPTQSIAYLYDSPVVYNRSMRHTASGWEVFNGDFHIRCVVGVPPTGIQPEEELLPKDFALMQNYPNPFNPVTTIAYALPEQSKVKLEIYNVLGARVAEVVQAIQPAGIHKIRWQPGQLASGIYFYRISAEGLTTGRKFTRVNKMILMK
ncbi:MAG: hypothetical protein Kow0042_15470 [Calditrichia bacterium]